MWKKGKLLVLVIISICKKTSEMILLFTAFMLIKRERKRKILVDVDNFQKTHRPTSGMLVVLFLFTAMHKTKESSKETIVELHKAGMSYHQQEAWQEGNNCYCHYLKREEI